VGPGGCWLRDHQRAEDSSGQALPATLEHEAPAAQGADLPGLLGHSGPPEPARQRRALWPVENLPVGACTKGHQQDRGADARQSHPRQEALRRASAEVDAQDGRDSRRPSSLPGECQFDCASASFVVPSDEVGRLGVALTAPQDFVEFTYDHDVGHGVADDAGRHPRRDGEPRIGRDFLAGREDPP